MLVYKIDVLKTLKEKGYNTTKLRKEKILGERTLQDFRNNRIVGVNILDKLCSLLECQISDIVEHIEDN